MHSGYKWCQYSNKFCYLMLLDHNWAQMCQNMYLFVHINHKWCQIKQILCFLMCLDHNWGQIYQNMYFLCTVVTDDVNTATNWAIWCFCTITGVKYIKICTSFKHSVHSWCQIQQNLWCFCTITGAKCIKICTACIHNGHKGCQIQHKECHLMLFDHNCH